MTAISPHPATTYRPRALIKTHHGLQLPAVLLLLVLLLAACRGESSADDSRIAALQVSPTPAVVGPAELVVELRESDGRPIDGAEVAIEGTMTHAGMAPVLVTATGAGGGRYVAPDFRFTMGGDWLIIVSATLPGGEKIGRTFNQAGVIEADMPLLPPSTPTAGP